LISIKAVLLQRIAYQKGFSRLAAHVLSACRQLPFPHCKTYVKPSWNFDKDVRILAGNSSENYERSLGFLPFGGLAQ
jgi:hypothetical protein